MTIEKESRGKKVGRTELNPSVPAKFDNAYM